MTVEGCRSSEGRRTKEGKHASEESFSGVGGEMLSNNYFTTLCDAATRVTSVCSRTGFDKFSCGSFVYR